MNEAETRKHILAVSRKCFLRFSYSKVTMDEVARELAMSKKTIYILFPSKKVIMEEVLKDFRAEVLVEINQILDDSSFTTIEKIRRMLVVTAEKFSAFSPYLLTDMERNVPDLWKQFKVMKHELVFKNVKRLLEIAQKNKEVRSEVNLDLLMVLYSAAVSYLRDTNFLNDFSKEIQDQLPATSDKTFEGVVGLLFQGILQA
ncbi:MAG: TetR/AcrR family transcriptional regulator [Bacteroidia bacterium]